MQEIDSIHAHRAGYVCRSLREEAHDGKRGHRLAAAGFSHNAQCCSPIQGEVHLVDRVGEASVVAAEGYAQSFDLEQAHVVLSAATALAISASMIRRSNTPAGSRRVGRNLHM